MCVQSTSSDERVTVCRDPEAQAVGSLSPCVHTEPFAFDYSPAEIHYGRDTVGELESVLAAHDRSRALVVCGRNTGANRALMDPVEAGLGVAHADTFRRTTPGKRLRAAAAAADRARDVGADTLVPVGGGATLDVATVAAVLLADGREEATARSEVRETGGLAPPSNDRPGLVPVPTTLAGADLSSIAGISVRFEDGVVASGVGDPQLMPDAVVYDPAAFATTPQSVLAGSACNGLNKAVESTYAANRTPVTDATARRALTYLGDALPSLFDGDGYDATALDRAVAGVILAQYGVSQPDGSTLNVLHAFGHALRDVFDLQQGVAHAVVTPHALRALFDAGVDPTPLAEGFGVPSDAVVDRVATIRDALELPTTIRGATDRTESAPAASDDIAAAARATAQDSLVDTVPPAFDLDATAAEEILTAAW